MTNIANMTVAAIADLYNGAIDDYGVNGFQPVDRFKSKAHAIERLEALCSVGNLAVTFDGENAVIVDATERAPMSPADILDNVIDDINEQRDATGDAAPAPIGAELSDAKGGIARSGFAYGSAEWLIANPRGTPARVAYQKARRLAARNMRKAERNARLEAATAE